MCADGEIIRRLRPGRYGRRRGRACAEVREDRRREREEDRPASDGSGDSSADGALWLLYLDAGRAAAATPSVAVSRGGREKRAVDSGRRGGGNAFAVLAV